MKSLVLLLLAVALVVPSEAISCRQEPERCGEGECCVEFGPFGRCRPLLAEGAKCELDPIKSRVDKHMYLMLCPCAEGLACEKDDGASITTGRCVQK